MASPPCLLAVVAGDDGSSTTSGLQQLGGCRRCIARQTIARGEMVLFEPPLVFTRGGEPDHDGADNSLLQQDEWLRLL